MNQSDSERISSMLEEMGYERSQDEESADILGVVACSVRQRVIDRIYSKIHEWNTWKKERNIITFASGCILPADHTQFLDRFDFIFRINELPKLPDMLRQYGVPNHLSVAASEDWNSDFWKITPQYSSAIEAFVPIQNGCDKFCTFCAVPYTRGREVSRYSGDILAEIDALLDRGCRSITLLGQNVNSYGQDRRDELSFSELLSAIGEAGENRGQEFWLYFTSPHPRDMTRDVIETISRYSCLADNIHLPIQSGDDKILIRMNRNYPVSQYRKVVHDVWELLPKATLFTDIIVGFTGETEKQFERTADIMREFRYNMAYIAQYSPRPGAASYRWKDDVSPQIKQERFQSLTSILRETSEEHNKQYLGKTIRTLVTGTAKRQSAHLQGKTEGRIAIQFPSEDHALIGQFVDLEVTETKIFSLAGKLLPSQHAAGDVAQNDAEQRASKIRSELATSGAKR